MAEVDDRERGREGLQETTAASRESGKPQKRPAFLAREFRLRSLLQRSRREQDTAEGKTERPIASECAHREQSRREGDLADGALKAGRGRRWKLRQRIARNGVVVANNAQPSRYSRILLLKLRCSK